MFGSCLAIDDNAVRSVCALYGKDKTGITRIRCGHSCYCSLFSLSERLPNRYPQASSLVAVRTVFDLIVAILVTDDADRSSDGFFGIALVDAVNDLTERFGAVV